MLFHQISIPWGARVAPPERVVRPGAFTQEQRDRLLNTVMYLAAAFAERAPGASAASSAETFAQNVRAALSTIRTRGEALRAADLWATTSTTSAGLIANAMAGTLREFAGLLS